MPLNIPSSPDPFPLGLHSLPLGLLDCACTQAGPTSSLERRVAQHTFTHASLINESSAALTNFPHPCSLMHWASLWGRPQHWRMKGGMRHQIVNSEHLLWTFTTSKHFFITLNWINCAVKLYSLPFTFHKVVWQQISGEVTDPFWI